MFQIRTFGVALALMARVLVVGRVDAFVHWLYLDSLSGCRHARGGGRVHARDVLLRRISPPRAAALKFIKTDELRSCFVLFHLFVFAMLLVTIRGAFDSSGRRSAPRRGVRSAPWIVYSSPRAVGGFRGSPWSPAVAGSLLALLGLLLLYQSGVGPLGNSYDFSIPVLAGAASHLSPTLAATAFLLVLVGFGTKAVNSPRCTPGSLTPISQAPWPILRDAVRCRVELRNARHLSAVHASLRPPRVLRRCVLACLCSACCR